MRPDHDPSPTAAAVTSPPPGRLARLFKVLVVGGAVLATAYASTLQGSTATAATPDNPTDGGGTQGW